MLAEPLIVTFPGTSAAEGNRLAGNLATSLSDIDESIVVDRQRELKDSQDLGATLAIMMGTAAATALAKGIATWMARNSGAQIEIRRKGKLVLRANNLDSKDIPRIAEAFSSRE